MNNLFVYAHLTPVYKNRAWVVVDGDDEGKKVIQELKEEYTMEQGGWHESNFINLIEPNFEKYYPERFKTQVNTVLSLPHEAKPAAKRSLLQTVLNFIENDREVAKAEFAQSADEVINVLRAIEESLFPANS